MQNFKEDKPQPVRDEYEYVSDDGELKIDEFPIRRKKTAPKRDLSCKLGGHGEGQTQPCRAILGGWCQVWLARAILSKPPTPICFGLSLTGQEGATAHTCYEAKAGLGALQGELLQRPRGCGWCAFCLGCNPVSSCATLFLESLWGGWLGSSGGDVSPRPCTEGGSRCGVWEGLQVCGKGGPQERPARCHEDDAAP